MLGRRPAEEDDDRRVTRSRSRSRRPAGPVADELDLRHELDAGLARRPRRGRRSTRRRTSAAVPFWSLTMKFACFSETAAPPIRRPLSPAASISRPAESPGGLRNALPADGSPSGWCACRQRRISSRRALIVAGVGRLEAERRARARSSPGWRLEPAVAVAQAEVRRGERASVPSASEDVGRVEDAGDVGLVRAGVGPDRAADRARDRQPELEARSGPPSASRSRPGPSARPPRRCSGRRRCASPRPGSG